MTSRARSPRTSLHVALTALAALAAVAGTTASPARGDIPVSPPAPIAPTLVLVALSPSDDARTTTAIGPHGELFEPDGAGAWIRTRPVGTTGTLVRAGRAGGDITVSAGGAIYKLADNGWTALRLAQKGKAILSSGPRAVGAVGRQLYALDRTAGGEPAKLGTAPASITAIGSGRAIVVATDRGLFRFAGTRARAIARAPRVVESLVDDRWARVARGVVDLVSNRTVVWPSGIQVPVARSGPGTTLVAVGVSPSVLELITVKEARLSREPLPMAIHGVPVDLVVDDRGRAVVALADGRLAVRDQGGTWTVTAVRTVMPPPRPGSPPARSR